jgi:hypothetical protein
VKVDIKHGGVLACVGVAALAFMFTPALFDLDDAYIPLYSAQVAVRGSDPVYGAPVLAGATSPAYVGLLIGLLSVGIRGLLALRIATAAGLSAYVFALWRLGGALRLPAPRKAAVLVLTLGSGLVFMQATNGLETGWALALLTFLISEAIRQNVSATFAAAAVLPFVRPDLVPAAGALVLYAGRGIEWRQKARAATIALLVGGSLFLWVRLDTGAWAPQTLQAKQVFFAEWCQPVGLKATAVYTAVLTFLLNAGPISICAAALWRERLGRYGLVAIALTLTAFLLRFPGGLAHNYSRYLYPILTPWLSFGVALRLSRGGLWASTRVVTALLAATFVIWPFVQPVRGDVAAELRRAAEWVDGNVPPDAVVLVHDAGAISMFAHRRAVDFVGLKTVSSIDVHQRWTMPSCGRDRAKAVSEIARASHASYLMLVLDWDEIFQLRSGLEANGWVLTPLRTPPPNARGYTIYRLTDARPVAPSMSVGI